MKNLIPILFAALMSGATVSATAAEQSDSVKPEPKFSIRPTGRILLDGAIYSPQGNGLDDGVGVPDVRAGVKMSYGNWSAKVDIGYSYGKVGMKDVYMQYTFNPGNLIRGGYFVPQFGLQSATSSSMKPTMEAPITDSYMSATSRNIGIMYIHSGSKFFAGATLLASGKSMSNHTNDLGKTSFGGVARLVYRPVHRTGLVLQGGVSGWYQTALHKSVTDSAGVKSASPGYFDWSVNYPTRVCSETMLGTTVSDARSVVKISPELLLSKGRLALEGQYYYMNVARKNGLPSYHASGVYGAVRGMILGSDYGYSMLDCGLATPAPKSLEVVAMYNYTDANTRKADLFGGISNDYSVTLNYYINKYMLARLRYSYTDVRGSDVAGTRHVNILQARLQIIF